MILKTTYYFHIIIIVHIYISLFSIDVCSSAVYITSQLINTIKIYHEMWHIMAYFHLTTNAAARFQLNMLSFLQKSESHTSVSRIFAPYVSHFGNKTEQSITSPRLAPHKNKPLNLIALSPLFMKKPENQEENLNH